MKNRHPLKPCYLLFLSPRNLSMRILELIDNGDELCEALWAEIKINRTLRVRDLKKHAK